MDKNEVAMPTTFDIASISSIVPYIGNLQRLEGIKLEGEPTVSVNAEKHWVMIRGKSSQVTYFFNDSDVITGKSRADAVFDYTMCKLIEGFKDGSIKKKGEIVVAYPLQDLVEIGLYEDIRTARRSFERAMKVIQSIQISGSKRIRKGPIGETMTHLISGSTIKKNIAMVHLGAYIDWKSEVEQFIKMPKEVFALSSQAYRLAKALYKSIRVNRYTDWFTVSFRYVAVKTGIVIDYNKPSRVRDSILSTVTELKDCRKNQLGIKINIADVKNLDEWLDQSILIVKATNSMNEDMAKIASTRHRKLKGK